MALGHLGVNVADLRAAKAYYDTLMPLVGYESFVDDVDQFAFRPVEGKPGTYLFFYPASEPGAYSANRVGLQHLAFMVKSRSAVHEVHRLAMGLGCVVLHAPSFFRSIRRPTSRRSGWIHSELCWKQFVTTTANEYRSGHFVKVPGMVIRIAQFASNSFNYASYSFLYAARAQASKSPSPMPPYTFLRNSSYVIRHPLRKHQRQRTICQEHRTLRHRPHPYRL